MVQPKSEVMKNGQICSESQAEQVSIIKGVHQTMATINVVEEELDDEGQYSDEPTTAHDVTDAAKAQVSAKSLMTG